MAEDADEDADEDAMMMDGEDMAGARSVGLNPAASVGKHGASLHLSPFCCHESCCAFESMPLHAQARTRMHTPTSPSRAAPSAGEEAPTPMEATPPMAAADAPADDEAAADDAAAVPGTAGMAADMAAAAAAMGAGADGGRMCVAVPGQGCAAPPCPGGALAQWLACGAAAPADSLADCPDGAPPCLPVRATNLLAV